MATLFTEERKLEMYRFATVAFGAAPGVFYLEQLREAVEAGLSTQQIVNIFTTKTEFTSVYSESLSSGAFASLLVANVIKDSASTDAKARAVSDIVEALNFGLSRGDVIFNVFGNLAGRQLDPTMPGYNPDDPYLGVAQQFVNQIAVGRYYTETLGGTSTNLDDLREVIKNVTDTSDVSSPAKIEALIGPALPEPTQVRLVAVQKTGVGQDLVVSVPGTLGNATFQPLTEYAVTAVQPDGTLGVAYTARSPGTGPEAEDQLFLRRFDAAGNPVGEVVTQRGIGGRDGFDDRIVDVTLAPLVGGAFASAYEDRSGSTDGRSVFFGRVLTTSNSGLSPFSQKVSVGVDSSFNNHIAESESGGYVAFHSTITNVLNQGKLFFSSFSNSGLSLSTLAVDPTGGSFKSYSNLSLGQISGGTAIVWTEFASGLRTAKLAVIANGASTPPEGVVLASAPSSNAAGNTIFVSESNNSILSLDSSRFVLTYTKDPSGSGPVFGQLFQSNGTKIGDELSLVDKSVRSPPAMSKAGSNGEFALAYSASDGLVFVRIFDRNGSPISQEMTVSSAGEFGTSVDIASADGVNFVVSFIGDSGLELHYLRKEGAPNSAPVAVDDVFALESGATSLSASVLTNDFDLDANAQLSVQIVTSTPAGVGSLTLLPTGEFVFSPSEAFSESTSFTYRVSDGISQSSIATAMIVASRGAPTGTLEITGISGDFGSSPSDFITNDTSVILRGTVGQTLRANEKIQLALVSPQGTTTVLGDATVNGLNWTFEDLERPFLGVEQRTYRASIFNSELNLAGPSVERTVTVDTASPSISQIAIASGRYQSGQAIDVMVTFTEPVLSLSTDSSITLSIGGLNKSAVFVSTAGATASYRYIVEPLTQDSDGIEVVAGGFNQGSGVFRDVAGNALLTGSPTFRFSDVNVGQPTSTLGFGVGGTYTSSGSGKQVSQAIALQADGKILIGGYETASGPSGVFLNRLHTDGTPDLSFNANVPSALISSRSGDERVFDVAVQRDGKIILVGEEAGLDGRSLQMVRLSPDGSLDLTFDGDGIYSMPTSSISSVIRAVALRPAGEQDALLVGGTAVSNAQGVFGVLLQQFTNSGFPDSTFGSGVLPGFTQSAQQGVPALAELVIDTQGRAYVVGTSGDDLFLTRRLPSGAIDTSFGGDTNGIRSFGLAGLPDRGNHVTLLSDGDILVTGTLKDEGFNPDSELVLLRYNTDGSLDTAFGGGDGVVRFNEGGFVKGFRAIEVPDSDNVASNNKIVVLGQASNGVGLNPTLFRFDSAGNLDASFGVAGRVVTTLDFDSGSDAVPPQLAIQADGKILVSGVMFNGQDLDAVVQRFNSDGSLDAASSMLTDSQRPLPLLGGGLTNPVEGASLQDAVNDGVLGNLQDIVIDFSEAIRLGDGLSNAVLPGLVTITNLRTSMAFTAPNTAIDNGDIRISLFDYPFAADAFADGDLAEIRVEFRVNDVEHIVDLAGNAPLVDRVAYQVVVDY